MHKFLAVGLLFISFSGFGQARRAQSLIEKLKYDVAFDLLESGLSKDTVSASIPFMLANLYLVQEWPRENLDSAFFFSVLSLKKYDLLTEKTLDKHIKEGFGKTRLTALKKEIDHLSFIVSKSGGLEVDYQRFINQHADAADIDSAIFLRNEQAFLTAQKANTLKSYKSFLENYPQAIDWQKANTVYQTKLYNESTAFGKLTDYANFANNHPQSPYYEACVQEIYHINGGKNTVKDLLKFANNYPKTKASKQAIGRLYHLHIAKELPSTFADKFPKLTISDSLQNVIRQQTLTLIPVWNNGYLQLIDHLQRAKIDSLTAIDYSTINKDYYSIEKEGTQQLIGKNGNPFYKGKWKNIANEKNGVIILNTETGGEVVHKNGDHFNIENRANIMGPFIRYKTKQYWGLKSITNKELTQAIYDSIWVNNGLILLKSKDKISHNKPEVFYPALDGEAISISTAYEEHEWLTDSLLWVANNDKEGLFSIDLEELIPLDNHRVDLAKRGWSITTKNNISVPEFSNRVLTSFKENNQWQIGSLGDSLLVKYNYDTPFSPREAIFLGPSAVILTWNDSSFVYLSDTIRFYKPENCQIKPLLNQNNQAYYYEITEGINQLIINHIGDTLDLPSYKKAIALNQEFFQLETNKDKSLYSSRGEQVLEAVDGVSLINDSTISILKDQKFGLIMPQDSIYVEPIYDSKLMHLIDSFWVFQNDKNHGLINLNNEIILPSEYDEITYWTNGLVFLKKDLKWRIYDLKIKQVIESGIIAYESITQNNIPTIRYQKGVGLGIFDSQKGVVIKPTFNTIYLEGSNTQLYYRAEKQVEEAALHIMLYYNLEGELLFKNIMSDAEFELLYGEVED